MRYYDVGDKQVWEVMLFVYGPEKFIHFCELNAMKYRLRAGKKHPDYETDLEKALWYENKIEEIKKEYELSN